MSEMSKAAFGSCQESETQRTHLDWSFLALAAAYIERPNSQHYLASSLFMGFLFLWSGTVDI